MPISSFGGKNKRNEQIEYSCVVSAAPKTPDIDLSLILVQLALSRQLAINVDGQGKVILKRENSEEAAVDLKQCDKYSRRAV
jgi:hypothetical protein